MKTIFNTLLITTLLVGSLALAPKTYADCQEIYGGSQNCTTSYTFTVQKLVQVPGKSGGNYISNLSINDAKYAPNSTVNFQIKVTNTSSQTIPTITITDVFPQYLSYVSGGGNFDTNAKTLTFTVNNLGAGETKTFNVTGKLADASLLPADQGVVCLINKANGTDNNGAVNSSSSQFCVEKQVLGTSYPVYETKGGITATPATGPEMLPLMALIPGGLGGLLLRRKSIKK